MRRLGLFVCGLLLAGCTAGGTDTAPNRDVLTGEKVLGEYETVDFCTLLGTPDGTPVSSFASCRVDANGLRRIIGPVMSDEEIGVGSKFSEPAEYRGDLPPGVALRKPGGDMTPTCLRWLGFSDHVWLTIAVSDIREPAASTDAQRCSATDDLVADVVAAVEKGRVKHVSYGPDSFGGIDPCVLLDRQKVGQIVGENGGILRPVRGHRCDYGSLGLEFTVDVPSVGTEETIAGRPVNVYSDDDRCFISHDRPLRDRSGLVEQATLSLASTGSRSGEELCPDLRAVAELVLAELPG